MSYKQPLKEEKKPKKLYSTNSINRRQFFCEKSLAHCQELFITFSSPY